MSFASLHKRVTYAMAGLGLASLFLGGELTWLAQGVVVLALVGSMFAEGERIERIGWQRAWNVALLVVLALAVLRGALGEPLLPLALEFTAALQISRLSNRRTATEHQQIAMLAFLHLCAATVLSTELAYGLSFLGFVVVAPWMLALTHLRSEIEGHYPGAPDPGRAADVRRVLASRRVVGPSFLLGTAALSLPLFVMTAGLFVLFPRVGLGLISFGRGSPTHVAGFGGDVELGQVGLVRDDPRVVLRVSPPGLPASPPARASIRMRGTSFDHYDGRRWSRTLRDPDHVGRIDSIYEITRQPDPGRDVAVSIVLDHLDETVVFLPDRTVAIEIPPRILSGIEVGRRLVVEPGLDLRYEDDDALGLRYRAWVAPDDTAAARERLLAESARVYLQLPDGHQRVASLAREWTAGASSDRERAELILARLRELRYSLEMRDPGARPPLEAFLFDWRAGHCEYFSSAMAVMLRSLGAPTRNVTGFLGGRWNEWGRWYAITNGDAHSWVEVWLDGEGWVAFDPTPAGRGELDFAQGLVTDLAAMIDALRTRWEEDVVGYDLRTQRSFARRLARWLRTFDDGRDAPSANTTEREEEPGAGLPWAHASILLGALALAFLAVRALVRRRGTQGAHTVEIPEAAREAVELYRALERALAALGQPRPSDRTPREHADRLAREGFAHAAAVEVITERYIEVRYGGSTLRREELEVLRARLREIERSPPPAHTS